MYFKSSARRHWNRGGAVDEDSEGEGASGAGAQKSRSIAEMLMSFLASSSEKSKTQGSEEAGDGGGDGNRQRPAATMLLQHTLMQDPPRTEGKRRKMWSKDLVQAFNNLLSSARFKPLSTAVATTTAAGNASAPKLARPFVFDEQVMEYTSEWCNACNLEATNHRLTTKMLFGTNATEEDTAVFMPMLNVPMYKDLPLGMRVMHDAYLFIYVTCCILAVFLRKLRSPASQAQVRMFLFEIDTLFMFARMRACF